MTGVYCGLKFQGLQTQERDKSRLRNQSPDPGSSATHNDNESIASTDHTSAKIGEYTNNVKLEREVVVTSEPVFEGNDKVSTDAQHEAGPALSEGGGLLEETSDTVAPSVDMDTEETTQQQGKGEPCMNIERANQQKVVLPNAVEDPSMDVEQTGNQRTSKLRIAPKVASVPSFVTQYIANSKMAYTKQVIEPLIYCSSLFIGFPQIPKNIYFVCY